MTDNANARDHEVMFPDAAVEIAGEKITVREFRYLESLVATPIARPIIAALRARAAAGEEITVDSIDAVIADNADAWLQLVSMSCGKPVAWVGALPDSDAMRLQLAFWGANNRFFTNRLLFSAMVAEQNRSRSSRPKSSTGLSGPDTGEIPPTLPAGSPGDKSAATTS